MKKLFTFVSLMAFASAMYAQDPSKWEKGQNVADEIGLKELGDDFSGTRGNEEYGRFAITSIGNVWKGDAPNEYRPGGALPAVFGFYNMGLTDFYQIVRVPAGSYTLKANVMYREGTPADNFANLHKGKKFKYGHMYANILADDQTTVTYENDLIVTSLAESGYHEAECLHYDSDGSWMNDFKDEFTKADGTVEVTWCPQCCEGFAKYFDAGCYLNEKKFVLTEDAYVRFGFRKTGSIPQDCLDFGNLQVIYDGPVTDESLFNLADEELDVVLNNLEALQEEFSEANFDALAGLLYGVWEGLSLRRAEAKTATELSAIKKEALEAMENYKAAQDVVLQVADIIASCEDMIASTEFAGKADFSAALEVQKAAKDESDEDKIGNPVEYYTNIVTALSAARATYLNTQEVAENQPKNFGSLINKPWFVNPEFTPVNEVEAGGDFWHLTEETWTAWEGPELYKNRKKDRTDISSKVSVSIDTSVKGQWYKYQNHTEGWCGGTELFHHGRLIGFSTGWASTFKNPDGKPGIEGVAQKLVGLPNGYYSVSCLVRGWDAIGDYESNPKFLGCFAENSHEVRVSSNPSNNTGNWWEWGSSADSWDDVETAVVLVDDGELLIGGGGSIANTVTGFRLNFYGAEPDFADLAQKKSDELRALISEDYFAGDKKKLNDLLNSVKHPVANASAYEEAVNVYAQFTDYQNAVAKKMKDYNAKTTLESVPDNWANPAYEYFASVAGKDEADTYEKVDEYNALANAYKALNDAYTEATEFKADETLKKTVEEQQATLAAGLASTEAVLAYAEALKTPILLNKMKALDCEAATADKPVDISTIMVNAKFDQATGNDGKTDVKTGWTSTVGDASQNEYGRNNAELWDKDVFTFSQKIANLPAGDYVLRVKALYRNGTACTADLLKAYKDNGGTTETWGDHNAVLFMKTSDENEVKTYIKSIYEYNSSVRSFDEVANARELVDDGEVRQLVDKKIQTVLAEGTFDKKTDVEYSYLSDGAYPFDTRVETKELDAEGKVVQVDGKDVITAVNYYPASMYGFYCVTQKDPNVYLNEVKITVEEGQTLELGIRKDKKLSQDWVIFSDFELEFLSGESFTRAYTGVENVTVNAAENGAVFNLAGQKVDGNFKGIVIKNGVKVLNK